MPRKSSQEKLEQIAMGDPVPLDDSLLDDGLLDEAEQVASGKLKFTSIVKPQGSARVESKGRVQTLRVVCRQCENYIVKTIAGCAGRRGAGYRVQGTGLFAHPFGQALLHTLPWQPCLHHMGLLKDQPRG